MKNEIVKRSVVKYINSRNQDISFESGKGCCVFTRTGERYIDFVLGYGPVVLGHSNELFNKKIIDLIPNGIHLPGFSVYHDNYIKGVFESVDSNEGFAPVFMKTSSESNTAAVRIASEVTKRKGVIRCGFTGWHDVQYAHAVSWHIPPGYRATIRNTQNMRGVSNEEEVFNWDTLNLIQLEDLLVRKGHLIACLIFDSFQVHFIDQQRVVKAFELCRHYGILIVLDETKTAGRVSPLGFMGQELQLWDILIMGKAIANGAPLSLLILKEKLREPAMKAQVGGTHSKELLSVYCALATQEVMAEQNGYKLLASVGLKVAETFNNTAREFGLADDLKMAPVFGGSLLDISFADKYYKNLKQLRSLQTFFLDNQVLLLAGHPSFVSLAHEDLDLSIWQSKLGKALHDWSKAVSNRV